MIALLPALRHLVAAALAGLAAPSTAPPPSDGAKVEATPSGDAERADVLRSALADARGAAPRAHGELLARLQTRPYLGLLDSDADYLKASKVPLHVSRVVEALAQNPAPSARAAFLALTQSRVYLSHDERAIGLVRAGVHVRPAPPRLVAFWDRHSRPDDGFTPTTIDALTANGSKPALSLLERKLASPLHPQDDRIAWMRTSILGHRNDAPLLEMCGRLLAGKLPRALRPALVEVLFDYKPGEWFRPATVRPAPPLSAATPDALAHLIRVGEAALKTVNLSDAQRAAVQQRLRDARQPGERGPL